jgi:hypothetical protein
MTYTRPRDLGHQFHKAHPSVFKRLKAQFEDPSQRSQRILQKLRSVDSSLAVELGGRGMMLRLFWFFNYSKHNPLCPICKKAELSVNKATRSFCLYCSGTCRNLDPAFRKKAFARFGGHPMKDPDVRAKVAKTWSKHFEGGHPSRDPVARQRMHGFGRKVATDVYGSTHRVQGYEDQVVKDLICSAVITDPNELPVIQYSYGGQSRRYFPDLMALMPVGDGSLCAASNYKQRLIEVKSVWTFLKDFDQNRAKFLAATAYALARLDMSFWVVVVLKDGTKIWCKNPTRHKLERLKERVT